MKQNDRVRSRDTGNLGTVTQAGQREGFVHVLFDGATDAICFDTGSLEPDWESQVAALSAERDALKLEVAKRGREIGRLFLHGVDAHAVEDEKRIAELEKQLAEKSAFIAELLIDTGPLTAADVVSGLKVHADIFERAREGREKHGTVAMSDVFANDSTIAFVRLSQVNPDGWKLNVGHREDVQKPVGLQMGYLHRRRDCVRLVQRKSGERAFEVIEVHGEILHKIRWCQSCGASMNERGSVSKESLPTELVQNLQQLPTETVCHSTGEKPSS